MVGRLDIGLVAAGDDGCEHIDHLRQIGHADVFGMRGKRVEHAGRPERIPPGIGHFQAVAVVLTARRAVPDIPFIHSEPDGFLPARKAVPGTERPGSVGSTVQHRNHLIELGTELQKPGKGAIGAKRAFG